MYHYGAAMAAYERLGNWQGALDLLSSIHELLGGRVKALFFWGGAFVCVKCVSDPQQDIYIYIEREVLNREIY